MAMAWIWTGMVVAAVLCGVFRGNISDVAMAAVDGAGAAVKLCIAIGGTICLWSGVMEIMKRATLSDKLAKLLKRPLSALFKSAKDPKVLAPLASNVSANLLGLGNAATPAGLKTISQMVRHAPKLAASDDMCMLVVINTASIQLIPVTVAAIRAASGARNAFDILPAVWLTSAVSVCAGIISAKILARIWRD